MRKLVGAHKDENGIYVKDAPEKPTEVIKKPKPTDISLDDFLESYLLILHRETENLLWESAQGKLDKENSQCMRDNLKLIMELKKQEKALLDNLSDEELKKLSKKYEE